MKTLLVLFSLICAAATQAQPGVCNSRAAFEAGYVDALAGNNAKPAREWGRNCSGYSPSSYQKDYDSGFLKGQREICDESRARSRGREDGLSYVSKRVYASQVFWACTDSANLDRVYKKAFVEQACRADVARELGSKAGEELAEGRPGLADLLEHCPVASRGELEGAFSSAYDSKARTLCEPALVEGVARSDARERKGLAAELGRLSRCPESVRSQALEAYRRGFATGEDAARQDKELELEKKKLEYERQKMLAERSRGRASFGRSFPTTFTYNRARLRATCEILEGRPRRALVSVANLSTQEVTFVGPWEIELRDGNGSYVGKERSYRSISLGRGDDMVFEVAVQGFKGRESERCTARFRP
jgi:hypothetical protein